MQLRKIVLLVLVLAVVALGMIGAHATGNHCDGQMDQKCHRGHNPDGTPALYCEVFIRQAPAPDLCWDGSIPIVG